MLCDGEAVSERIRAVIALLDGVIAKTGQYGGVRFFLGDEWVEIDDEAVEKMKPETVARMVREELGPDESE